MAGTSTLPGLSVRRQSTAVMPTGRSGSRYTASLASAFALAEHLTGVRLTPELLGESVYLWGVAPEPKAS